MSSIKVAIRCRPMLGQERPATGLDIQGRRILLDSKTYDPDFTFPPTATQDDLFAACRPILQCVKEGLNGTLMVYGQTGTGKTYTMLGADGADNGLVHKVIAHMLEHVQLKTLDGAQCALTLSMIEIYNEKLTDMLSENGEQEVTLVAGFPRSTTKVTLGRLGDANEAVKKGLACRHTAATMMNERSSRSHVVFIVDLEEYNAFTEEMDVAHLFMVDLAGSESIKKSQATGSTAGEAGKINKSLLALKSVFLALSNTNEATRPPHVPYRDSRLTELLQDSIGGTARTLMIACISAVGRDIEETKSTLSYAVKARSIRNAANTEKEKLLIRLRAMEAENQRLRNRLQERVNERGGYFITKEEHERYEVMEAESKELRETVEALVKDSQASDARKHISESQTKILQGLVDQKEAELQSVKGMYHHALQQFERNASALQRIVQGAVGDVHRTLQGSAAQRHDRLMCWKGQLLALLAVPPPDGPVATAAVPMASLTQPSAAEADNEETAVATPFPVSPPRPARVPSARGSLAGQSCHNSSSTNNTNGPCIASPSRRGARAGLGLTGGGPRRLPRDREREHPPAAAAAAPALSLHTALDEASEPSLAGSPVMSPGGTGERTTPSPGPAAFLQEADNACHAMVHRVNTAFVELVRELMAAYDACDAASARANAAQAQQTDSVCEELRSHVEACVAKLKKVSARASDDAESAKEDLRSRFRVLEQQYLPDNSERHDQDSQPRGLCEARPFQHIVREACAATLRSGEACFPPPDVPAEVTGSLGHVVRSYQSRLAGMYANALQPLATTAAESPQQQQAFQALLAASAQQQQLSQSLAARMGADGDALPCPPTLSESAVICSASGSPSIPSCHRGSIIGGTIPPLAPASAPSLSQTSQTHGGGPLLGGVGSPTAPPSQRAPPSAGSHSSNNGCSSSSGGGIHSRTASYTSATGNAVGGGKENRYTTGSRLSNAGAVSSARGSLRAARTANSANASPRPLKKRPRSALPEGNPPLPLPAGRSSAAPESGRRTPSSRTEPRK